ncbi:hypothetical protein C8T65DRAFT_700233 [Cerioporus squamosus]|nr:hypothetical protein C8T65DRAFT_700233 [Cerioporus squamosus]
MRTHLTIHAQYSLMQGRPTEGEFVKATINVVEVQDDSGPAPRSHWGVGIYPATNAEMINMCSDEWTCSIDESMKGISFTRRGDTPLNTITHMIKVADPGDFMQLFSLCSHIKIYYYSTFF